MPRLADLNLYDNCQATEQVQISTPALVAKLKQADEDHEWYPTTDDIINTIADDIRKFDGQHNQHDSILDIGAGDGRVLTRISDRLTSNEKNMYNVHLGLYAIEKSRVHLNNLPKDIVVIGTDFHEQTLVDKRMAFTFCNPPYSEFEDWAYRIIRECPSPVIYLVIPKRWRRSERIKLALESRGIDFDGTDGEDEDAKYAFFPADVRSLGEFDFHQADRQARVEVEIVRISARRDKTSTFDTAIEDMLPELKQFDMEDDVKSVSKDDLNKLAEGGSLIESLVFSYDSELAKLYETYRAVVKISPSLLKSLGVTKDTILSGVREKISSLKDKYWEVLFDNLSEVTKRLATKQRNAFLESLKGKAVIDFTEGNIFSMLIWVTKWASDHFDDQVVDLFKAMAQKATVEKYKSNDKVFTDGHWRYLNEEASHYKLCYRLVLETHGGIYKGSYGWENQNGLCKSARELLSDFITVANNLGFECDESPMDYEWKSNKKIGFTLKDGEPLMDVRAFLNGNIHIRVAKPVMLAINVQAGKLLGWLRSADEAIREMEVEQADEQAVRDAYGISLRIEPKDIALRIAKS
jgi:hypothetical protein